MSPRAFFLLMGGVLLCGAGAAGPDGLGRLFTTPEQRAFLDAGRNEDPALAPLPAADGAAPSYTVDGVLLGSDGLRRIWLNGTPLDPSAPGTPATLLPDGRVRLRLGDGTTQLLKPGQTLEPDSRAVLDAWQRGAAAPAAPPPTGPAPQAH